MAWPTDPLAVEVGLRMGGATLQWSVVGGRIIEPSGREFIAAGMNGGVTIDVGGAGTILFGGAGKLTGSVAWAWDGVPGNFNVHTDIWPGDTNLVGATEVFPGGHVTASPDQYAQGLSGGAGGFTALPDRVYALTGARSAGAIAAGIAAPVDHWHCGLYRIAALTRPGPATWNNATDVTPANTIPQYVARARELVDLGLTVSVAHFALTGSDIELPAALVSNPSLATTDAALVGSTWDNLRDALQLLDALCAEFTAADNFWLSAPNESHAVGVADNKYRNMVKVFVARARANGFGGIFTAPLAEFAGDLGGLATGAYDTLIDELDDENMVWEWHNYGKNTTTETVATYAETDAQLTAVRAAGHALWLAEYGQATPVGTGAAGPDAWNREAVLIMATDTYGGPLGEKHPWLCPTWWVASGDNSFDRSYALTYGPANKGNESGPDPHAPGTGLGTYPWWDVTTSALRDEWLTPGGRAHWDLAHAIWQGVSTTTPGPWVDAVATGHGVRHRDGITINHGRANWSSVVDPGRASFVLDNRDGRWSPDNPASPFYGLYRRNIPCRVGIGRGEIHMRPTGISADLASTPDILGGGGPGTPTAPAHSSVTQSTETTNTITHDVTLPATVNVTDRLLLVISAGHESLAATGDLAGWTLVESGNLYTPWHRWLCYEIEASTSGIATALAGATIQFTTAVDVKSSAQVIRVTGARSGGEGTAWEAVKTGSTSFSAAPNSPALSTIWAAEPVRWYTVAIYGSGGDDVSAYPSSYTSIADTGGATSLSVASAHRTTTAATEDPGAFTLTGDENWQALTFVYRGTEVAGTDGVLDISGDIDLRIEFEGEEDLVNINPFSGAGAKARLAHKSSGADGWEWDIYATDNAIDEGLTVRLASSFTWRDSSGVPHTITTEQTGTDLPLEFLHEHRSLRVDLDVNNGASGHTLVWYTSTAIDGTWTQLGSSVVVAGTTSIKTNDAPLRVGGNPGDGGATYIPYPGKIYAFQLRNSSDAVVANPAFNAQPVGATWFTDGAGRVWTVGAGGRISGMLWRFHGELSSLPVRWTVDGADIVAPVEAAGLFRRLRQGARLLESALRRGIMRVPPVVQYWPMEEDGDNLAQFGAAIGTAPLVCSGGTPNTSTSSVFVASSPLPTLGDTALTATVDTYPAGTKWEVTWVQHIPATFTGDNLRYMRVETTDIAWDVEYRDDSGGQLQLHALRGTTTIHSSGWVGFGGVTGKARRLFLFVTQAGSTVDYQWAVQDPATGGPTSNVGTITVAGSAGQVTRIRVNKDANVDTWTFGHLTLGSERWDPLNLVPELAAHTGERAASRVQRLCREEGLRFRIEGDPATTEEMGPQRPAALMALLQECADTDLGILHESRETVAIAYRTRVSMLDQPIIIDLDYTAGEVAASPELDRDDDDFANDVTVRDRSGSTARAVLDDGSPMSVSEPPVGAGRYDRSYSVNGLGSRLQALADTRLALTTVDEPRVSRLPLALHHAALAADTALTSAILDASLGDRVRVANNLPLALGSADIDQLMQGTREEITSFTHTITALTTPSSPWTGGGVAPPPEEHTVVFRSQATLATPGTPPHVLTALGYTGAYPITRAQLDDILDDWVAGTGGTTRNVTSAGTWTTAVAAALPGDLIRCTSSFDPGGALTARGNKYGISGSNMTASPAGGTAGLPIIFTCADGVTIDDNNQASNVPVLDFINQSHTWAVGFNVREGQFGIRAINWGGSSGFPAYRAYNNVADIGHSGIIAQGWGSLITGAGGTPPSGSGNEEGFSEWFVDEENTVDGVGQANSQFGEIFYYGKGSDPGYLSHCRDFWVRGNHGMDFTSDGIDIKPGCLRWKVTDNDWHLCATHFGAVAQLVYIGAGAMARPAWAVDPEGVFEGNRVWDHSITKVQANSSQYVIQCSMAGVRIANNIAWAIADANTAGTPSGTGMGVHLRSERTRSESRVGSEKWVIVNNIFWTGQGVFNGGGGVGGGFEGPFDSSWIDARNNIGFTSTTGVQHTATTADFIDGAAIPAIGSNSADATWETYGPGSAFDLALSSDLIGVGSSITDIDLFIDADVSQRAIPNPPNPGPYQEFQ